MAFSIRLKTKDAILYNYGVSVSDSEDLIPMEKKSVSQTMSV